MKRERVKEVATSMVETFGLINLSRRELCERAGIPDGSFPHVMGCTFAEFITELRHEDIKEMSHDVVKSRVSPELRKDHILNTAINMSKVGSYDTITRDKIAESAGVSMGLVTRYFGTMKQLRVAVMRRAVKRGILEIIAQGLAKGDPQAKKASPELKAKSAALLADL